MKSPLPTYSIYGEHGRTMDVDWIRIQAQFVPIRRYRLNLIKQDDQRPNPRVLCNGLLKKPAHLLLAAPKAGARESMRLDFQEAPRSRVGKALRDSGREAAGEGGLAGAGPTDEDD